MTDKTKKPCATDGCGCDSTTPATAPASTTAKAVTIKPSGRRPAKETKAKAAAPKATPKAPTLEAATPTPTAETTPPPAPAPAPEAAPKPASADNARAPHGFGARTKTGHYAKLTKSEKHNLVWLGKLGVVLFAIVMAILLVYNFGTRFNSWVFTPVHHTRVHHGHHGPVHTTPPPAAGGHKATPPPVTTTPGDNGTPDTPPSNPNVGTDDGLGAGAPGPYICTHGRTPELPVSMQRNCLFKLNSLDNTIHRIFDFDNRWIVLIGDDNPAFGPAVAYNGATGRLYEVPGSAAHVGRRRLWKDMSQAQKASFHQMCIAHYIFPSDCPA